MESINQIKRPVLAVSTRFAESVAAAVEIAAICGFRGVDLAVTPENVYNLADEHSLIRKRLGSSTEIRHHAYFPEIELAHADSGLADEALQGFKKVVVAVWVAGGRNLTIHIGSNPNEHGDAMFHSAVDNLTKLVDFAAPRGLEICVENLRSGVTSSPSLFSDLVEQSNASVALDIGHAMSSQTGLPRAFPFDLIDRLGTRIRNAHVYEREDDKFGHIAPSGLMQISSALDALRTVGCDWWVIELKDQGDIHRTNALLNGYFHNIASEKDRVSAIVAP